MKQKDRISEKDLYKEAWKGRDFEVSNLWQRSIFLTVFLLVVITAYGSLWNTIFTSLLSCTNSLSFFDALLSAGGELQIAFIVISFLGIIFSLLWIGMSKGSKYWYEKYERAIDFFVKNNEEYFKKKAQNDEVPCHGNLGTPRNYNNSFFSTKAGQYSPSRVNILIGQIFYFFWTLIYILHTTFLIKSLVINNCIWQILFVVFITIAIDIAISGNRQINPIFSHRQNHRTLFPKEKTYGITKGNEDFRSVRVYGYAEANQRTFCNRATSTTSRNIRWSLLRLLREDKKSNKNTVLGQNGILSVAQAS